MSTNDSSEIRRDRQTVIFGNICVEGFSYFLGWVGCRHQLEVRLSTVSILFACHDNISFGNHIENRKNRILCVTGCGCVTEAISAIVFQSTSITKRHMMCTPP
jgi:hypothetical protein